MSKYLKILLMSVLIFLAVFSYLAFGRSPDYDSISESVGADRKTVVSFAASQNWIRDIDYELAEQFEDTTGIKISFSISPDDQYHQVLKARLATGEASDIFMIRAGASINNLFPEKNMEDLSGEKWVSRMEEWAVESVSFDGKLYAMNTWSHDVTNGICYNPEMFARYNIAAPTTYSEFTRVCEKLIENGVIPIYEFVNELWHTHYWIEGVSYKARLRDPQVFAKLNENKLKFSEVEEFQTAMQQLDNMRRKGYMGRDYMTNTYGDSFEALASGKYAMILIHSSWQNEVAQKFPASGAERWKMFPEPLCDNTSTAMTGGGIVKCIYKYAKAKEEAKAYFEFLAESQNLQVLYNARRDFAVSAFRGITVTPPEGLISMRAISKRDVGVGAECAVLYYDGISMTQVIQEMFVNALTPAEALQKFDGERDKTAMAAGARGWLQP